MTPPTVAPYSEEELADIRDWHKNGSSRAIGATFETVHRLIATLDTLRAENKGLREEREALRGALAVADTKRMDAAVKERDAQNAFLQLAAKMLKESGHDHSIPVALLDLIHERDALAAKLNGRKKP